MVRKIRDLDRKGQLQLLQAISEGRIDKKSLSETTIVTTEYGDFFLGLMIAATT
jgi:hypothetical protein